MAVTEMEQTHMDIITDNQRGNWGPFLDLSEALAPFSTKSDPRFRAGLDLLDDAVMRTLTTCVLDRSLTGKVSWLSWTLHADPAHLACDSSATCCKQLKGAWLHWEAFTISGMLRLPGGGRGVWIQ